MANFEAILNIPNKDIERPKPLPPGTYYCVVLGQPKFDVSSQQKTEYAEFTLGILATHEDVNAEDLKVALNGKPLTEKTIRATYYLTEAARWRLREFLDHCGVEEGDDDTTIGQRIAAASGCHVLANLKHSPTKTGTAVYAELASTAAVPA